MKGIKMEIKKHFKLYKSGKQWVTAAVATVAVSTALLYGGVAHADQQDQSSTTQDQTSAVNVDTAKTVVSTDQSMQTTNKNQAAVKIMELQELLMIILLHKFLLLHQLIMMNEIKVIISKTMEIMEMLTPLTLTIINYTFQGGMQQMHLKEQIIVK